MSASLRVPSPATPPAPAVGAHARHHGSVLASLEKRALVWIAHRLPRAVGSDHLTALGLIAMLGVGLGYWLSASRPVLGLCVATGCLALNWLGDSLDGTLARFRHKQRPRYGFYVDHVVDMLGALCNDRAHRSARRGEFDGIR